MGEVGKTERGERGERGRGRGESWARGGEVEVPLGTLLLCGGLA